MFSRKNFPAISIDYYGKHYQLGQLYFPTKYEMVSGEITLTIKLEPEQQQRIAFCEFWERLATFERGKKIDFTVYGTQYHALHTHSQAKVISNETRNGVESAVFLDWTVNLIK